MLVCKAFRVPPILLFFKVHLVNVCWSPITLLFSYLFTFTIFLHLLSLEFSYLFNYCILLSTCKVCSYNCYESAAFGLYSLHSLSFPSVSCSRMDDLRNFLAVDKSDQFVLQAPYQRKLMDLSLLTPEEVEWVNTYHSNCRGVLAPYMDEHEMAWLRRATEPIRS